MEDILCVNDFYSESWRLWALENNVKHPIKGKIYTIREIKRHSNSSFGVLLNEIHNPLVDPQMPLLKGILVEVTFAISRFRKLNGEPLNEVIEEELETI